MSRQSRIYASVPNYVIDLEQIAAVFPGLPTDTCDDRLYVVLLVTYTGAEIRITQPEANKLVRAWRAYRRQNP
jgi:hypothetical protein